MWCVNTNFLVLIIFFFNNFEETRTKLAFLLSTVEGERWMLPHLKQVSAYTRNKKGKLSSCLKDLSSEDCLRILPSPM